MAAPIVEELRVMKPMKKFARLKSLVQKIRCSAHRLKIDETIKEDDYIADRPKILDNITEIREDIKHSITKVEEAVFQRDLDMELVSLERDITLEVENYLEQIKISITEDESAAFRRALGDYDYRRQILNNITKLRERIILSIPKVDEAAFRRALDIKVTNLERDITLDIENYLNF